MKAEELEFISSWQRFLGAPEKMLEEFAFTMPDSQRYKHFAVPKSNGGLRIISEPIEPLKEIQHLLLNIFNRSYAPLESSHGFIAGRSILTNAKSHVRKSWVFNADLEKFFPAIRMEKVESALSGIKLKFLLDDPGKNGAMCYQDIQLSDGIVSFLANLCCFRSLEESTDPESWYGLPQGAPTSPVLSDMVARGMDEDLLSFCAGMGIEYTRYADDMSFSPLNPKDYSGYRQLICGENTGKPALSREVLEIIQGHGFRINVRKNKLFNGKSCKQVTGLSVNEFPNVPRKLIRSIRQDLYLWKKHGHERASEIMHEQKNYRHKKCPKRLCNMLHGKLMFLSMVRGKGDPIYLKFVRKLKELEHRDIMSTTEEGFVCKWDPSGLMGDKNSWEPKVEIDPMNFRVNLEDFPKRSAKHFAGRRLLFIEQSGNLRGMLRTEVGSWAYERLQHIFDLRKKLIDEFTYDPIVKGGKCLLEYMLEAEAAYLHTVHDDLMEGQAQDAWSALFFRVMEINADICAAKLLDPAFQTHLEHINWGVFFRHQNDEFLSQRYGYEKFDVDDLTAVASTPKRRRSPCSSLMLWTALAPMALNAKDRGLGSHRKLYKETLEGNPYFFLHFDDVLTSCTRSKDGNPPSMTITSLRKHILNLIQAFGRKAEPSKALVN